MASLRDTFAAQIPGLRSRTKRLIQEHGNKVISEVTIAQALGGMREVKGLVCDTSLVEPDQGLVIRGYPIKEIADKLPEEIWWLLITGKLPTAEELKGLQKEINNAAGVPSYVWDVLRTMPRDSHPMTMLDTGILVLQRESEFARRYREGIAKTDLWEPMLQDAIKLVACVGEIAAGVYRIRFNKGDLIPYDKKLDWAANYAKMTGIPDPSGDFADLIRLYFTLHSDHEGGNVSAFTCHVVGSALSDAFYSVSAGLNGLAGPLHGLANQECLRFVITLRDKFGGVPSDEALRQFAWDTLNSGRVIPGYGHTVLRITDPRFESFLAFGKKRIKGDPVFDIVCKLFEVVPGVLKEQGKAKDPWPNVDAGSGALLYHYGMTEIDYYTVLFSVSRVLGMTAQLLISRALGEAITRPKSVQTDWLEAQAKK